MLDEMKNLLTVTGGGLRFIILLTLRSPTDVCITMIQALFLRNAFNAIELNDNRMLGAVCLAFIIATLSIFLYNGTIWILYSRFVVRMEGRLRVKLFKKITEFSYERIESAAHSDLITRLNSDVQMPFSQPLHFPHLLNATLRITVSAVILWLMIPAIFGLIMLFVVPHILLSQFLIARAMPGLNKNVLEVTAKNTGELNTLIICADIAVLYDGKGYLMNRFEQSSLDLVRAKMKIRNRNALSAAILPVFGLGGYLILLIVSSAWIADGKFTFGDLTAAFQYRGGVLAGSLMLINCLISIQASMAGIRRINETMSVKLQ